MVRSRTASPITHVPNKDEGEMMIMGPQKIHRIVLTHETICTVSHVTSPSCIWLKLRNNIVETQLQITCDGRLGDERNLWSDELKPLKNKPEARHYVMAPRDENIYGRARVLEYDSKNPDFVYILFIDHGDCCWVHWRCLAEISHVMKCHPWQAIPVALFKLFPTRRFMGEEEPTWTREDLNVLEEIIENYTYFRVKPIFGSLKYNDYSININVELFGLRDNDDFIGDSIAHLFKNQRVESIIKRKYYDSVQQPMFSLDDNVLPPCSPNDVEEFRLEFPIKIRESTHQILDIGELNLEEDDDVLNKRELKIGKNDKKTEEAYPEIKLIKLADIREEFSDDGKFCILVNGSSTVSPYEFYAYPLRLKEMPRKNSAMETGKRENPAKEVHALIDDRIQFSDELDTWYGQQANRHAVDASTVRTMLEKGKPVFGIYEVYSEHSETGSWRRVEIIGLRPIERNQEQPMAAPWQFCRVRFLDFGGTDIVPVANILKIHASHCTKPVMCMPLCMNKIEPITGNWTEKLNAYFRSVLRGDIPIICELEENFETVSPAENLEDKVPAPKRRGVIFVKNLRVMTRPNDPTMEEKLVHGTKTSQAIAKFKE
uniref:Tudor domain-containing protein n=1 Tax=Acrobeloides nanus TaxID=290746 RepID=A0A914CPT6_9BILA